MAKDKKRSSTDAARRIWLAGIGAYGRAFTEAQEALKDVTGKGSEVFDELVQKGEMLEMVGKAKSKEVLNKAKVPDFDFDIDDRIKAMRSRLSRGADADVPAVETDDFEARLSTVEAKLDEVLALFEPKTARKKPTKKATTQRTTKAKKPTAKK